jgi:hypothetical protein
MALVDMFPDEPDSLDVFKPREERNPVGLTAKISLVSGNALEAEIRNLSRSGFHAECSGRLLIGSRISVVAPNFGSRAAQVRWALGGRIGAVFDVHLDEQSIAASMSSAQIRIPDDEGGAIA